MNPTLLLVLAVLMIVLGAAFIYFIVRENERPLPQGGLQWAATALSTLLIVFSSFLLLLTLVPDAAYTNDGTDPLPSEMNEPAPDFAFRVVEDDAALNLGKYQGQVVLLNFWATWCAPCISELPDLSRLQQNYAGDGLVVLTISDEPRGDLLAFEETMPLRTVAGYVNDPTTLPQPFRRTLAIRPTTYIIDRQGVIRHFIKGAGTYAFFEETIRPYLQDTLAAR